MELYNDDCFNVFPKIKDKSINLFLLDLPYGQTACKWDSVIDLDKMWVEVKRMMKPNGIILFFCTAKFGNTIINSNPKWFKYDLIWKKSRKVGFLSANKMPLRQHENLYVFKDELGTYNPQKTKLDKPDKRNRKNDGNQKIVYGDNVDLPIESNYKDRHPTSIIEHENIYVFNDKPVTHSKNEDQEYSTYNPQKTEGKPYKVLGGKSKSVDGSLSRGHEVISKEYINNGDRHPTSVIEHENIYVFNGNAEDNQEGKLYAKKILDYIGKTKTQINKILGHRKAEHFFYFKEDVEQFSFPTEEVYNELIKHFKIDEMSDFIPFLNITYNPQKTEGKPYKSNERIETDGVYIKDSYKRTATKDTTNRHPTSIIENTVLEYNNPAKSLHRTQKPVELCEWLIKTYTNEDDIVMDFTMGSGTTGIACSNTNREFIGVEMDKEIFEIAEKRILEHLIL